MSIFCNNDYETEAKKKWGNTDAYKEQKQKTSNYSKVKWQQVNDGLMAVFGKFAKCKQNGNAFNSDEAQALVKELQDYISTNYYTCTNQILRGLGQMYMADERFKNNIDAYCPGTAEFVSKSIEIYYK